MAKTAVSPVLPSSTSAAVATPVASQVDPPLIDHRKSAVPRTPPVVTSMRRLMSP